MLTEKDYCDYETCVALKELGYNQPSIAFYPCQDIIVDCIDSNGELYEAEYDKGNLALYSSLNNKNHDINKVQAPLLYEAQKWLREEFGMLVNSMVFADNSIDADGKVVDEWIYYSYSILNTSTAKFIRDYDHSGECDTYEEALAEGIKEAVKILKDGKGI